MTIIANRYQVLEKLGAGGMGAVWLVHDKLRNQKVALKQVLMSDDDQRLAITREFRTLSTLRHPNIVGVIEYGFHENQPYFTMDYLPDSHPFDHAPDQKIERFIQMLQALGYLHRRGILHRDLKPANVLVTSDGVVKVLDFGLSRSTMSGKSALTVGIVGTLTYLAPEVLNEDPPTVGSDLWAVGVMLCEFLTGHHPFDISSIIKLMMSLMSGNPNLSGMDEKIAKVVARILSKNSTERYTSALEVLRDLSVAAKIELPTESQAQRESFLQAAAFVGRDREYQSLSDGLKLAAGGIRQLWLIGGEAGAGKSRLFDELRTRALVDGFVVLQGQGVEGGGLPYQLWRDPARKLVLGAPMSDLTASVLKELVPDIATLLDRDVSDLVALDPKANRDRLMAALLGRLQALESPILIMLEDLHWTGESLELLKMLLPQLASMPVMTIGSYRNDEKPDLPQALPDATLLTMERLSPEAVAALSASMIGAENATPELVERLTRETEGNALFMVEVMRALAEEAGSLDAITRKSLPEKIFAGGMVAVLRRRLERVPSWALDTLKLAAVIGRVLDIPVLETAGVTDISKWLQACADAVVLEPYQGEWRFSHDRLREVLLHEIAELAPLHEKAALAIETVYPNNVSYAEALAEHWRIAGNAEREVVYILKAAEHLINISGDYNRAESLIQRGLALNLSHTRAELLLWVGNAAEKQGQYETALSAYQNGLEANPTSGVQAALLSRVGFVCYRQGNYAGAGEYARQAQTVAEAQGDQRNLALSLNLLGGVALYQGDYPPALAYFQESLRIRREIGDRQGAADSLNNLGAVAVNQGDYRMALAYFQDSLRIYRELGDRQGTAMCLSNLGVVAMYQGDYVTALAYYEDSLRIRREIGDRLGTAVSLGNLGDVAFYERDYGAACAAYEESLLICRDIGGHHLAVYAAAGWVMALVKSGQRDSARDILIEGLTSSHEVDTLFFMLMALLGAAYYVPENERAAVWIGLMGEQGSAELTDDIRFKRLSDEIRVALGDEAFNAAVERGKSLDVRAEIDGLLAELTGKLAD